MQYVQFILDGMKGYINPLNDDLGPVVVDEMKTMEPGMSLELVIVEMTQEEYDNLPEFQGW